MLNYENPEIFFDSQVYPTGHNHCGILHLRPLREQALPQRRVLRGRDLCLR